MFDIFWTDLKVGGRKSGGRCGGKGKPDIAMSIKCMARINSSAVSFPSWSMSERFLQRSHIRGTLNKSKPIMFIQFNKRQILETNNQTIQNDLDVVWMQVRYQGHQRMGSSFEAWFHFAFPHHCRHHLPWTDLLAFLLFTNDRLSTKLL